MLSEADRYPPEEVEERLQAGDLAAAERLGWFGDEWSYRLVQTGAGAALALTVAVDRDAGVELGLDLSNDTGVATVSFISPTGAVGRDGRLRIGDVVRQVNGGTLYTCEAVVRAIKGASHGRLELVAVRPPPIRSWSKDGLELRAGAHAEIAFELDAPACLLYRYRVPAHDVGFSVVRLARGRGGRAGAQATLEESRAAERRGHVLLPQPGRHAVSFDNTFSLWRGKHVSYALRLLPLGAWEASQQRERLVQVDDEIAACRARSAELKGVLGRSEARAAALRAELGALEATLDEARRRKEENRARLRAAKQEREGLLRDATEGASAAAEFTAGSPPPADRRRPSLPINGGGAPALPQHR